MHRAKLWNRGHQRRKRTLHNTYFSRYVKNKYIELKNFNRGEVQLDPCKLCALFKVPPQKSIKAIIFLALRITPANTQWQHQKYVSYYEDWYQLSINGSGAGHTGKGMVSENPNQERCMHDTLWEKKPTILKDWHIMRKPSGRTITFKRWNELPRGNNTRHRNTETNSIHRQESIQCWNHFSDIEREALGMVKHCTSLSGTTQRTKMKKYLPCRWEHTCYQCNKNIPACIKDIWKATLNDTNLQDPPTYIIEGWHDLAMIDGIAMKDRLILITAWLQLYGLEKMHSKRNSKEKTRLLVWSSVNRINMNAEIEQAEITWSTCMEVLVTIP